MIHTMPTSSFYMPNGSFDYDGSSFQHSLSPHNDPCSASPPVSFDMSLYPDDSSSTNSSNGAKRSKRGVSAFITKLYGMVGDRENQSLIFWSPKGLSFLICNSAKFAQEVLPVHFKHNNFSSFVRQLNMYGFHKINKSLRGQRGSNENEIWEFSHGKFQYGRPDLLEEIKRKAMDSELLRREAGDIHASFAMVQLSQSELLQQFSVLQENYTNLLQSFEELKKTQLQQQIIIRRLAETSAENKVKVNQQEHRYNMLVGPAPQWHQQHDEHQQQQGQSVASTYPTNTITASSHAGLLPPSPVPSDPTSHSESPYNGDISFRSTTVAEYS